SGDHGDARAQLHETITRLAALMARPTPKRAWRLAFSAPVVELQGRLADSQGERQAAIAALAAFMNDVRLYESQGGVVPQLDAIKIAGTGVTQGDLLARAGHAERAREAWLSAAARVRPIAERLNPAA